MSEDYRPARVIRILRKTIAMPRWNSRTAIVKTYAIALARVSILDGPVTNEVSGTGELPGPHDRPKRKAF